MFLNYINNTQINNFVKQIKCANIRSIMVEDSESRNYVNVFTTALSTTLHFTDFECINIETGEIHSKDWRKFIIAELDKIDENLTDKYIDGLHEFLEQDTVYGPIL